MKTELEKILFNESTALDWVIIENNTHLKEHVLDAMQEAFELGKSSLVKVPTKELIQGFIDEIKTEFHDQNWDYLEFVMERYLGKLPIELNLPTNVKVPTDEEIEKLRMQLVACGVCAQSNTEKSKASNRIDKDNIYWSVSYEDVCRCVDREIELSNENKALKNRIAILEKFIPKSENNVVADDALSLPNTVESKTEWISVDERELTIYELTEQMENIIQLETNNLIKATLQNMLPKIKRWIK